VDAKTGMLVKAAAGRDKNKFFVITELEGKYAYIADGKSRKLEYAKKKSLKHVKLTNTVIDMAGLTDKKLRKLLNEYSHDNDAHEGGSNFV